MTNNKLGLLVIHMTNIDSYHYDYGSLKNGICNVRSVITNAAKRETPIFLSEFERSRTDQRLFGGIENVNLLRYTVDGFAQYFENPIPVQVLESRINRLIVTGFNRIGCVLAALEKAREYGIIFATSDDLLFGNKYDSKQDKDAALTFFQNKGVFYPNYQILLEHELKYPTSIPL